VSKIFKYPFALSCLAALFITIPLTAFFKLKKELNNPLPNLDVLGAAQIENIPIPPDAWVNSLNQTLLVNQVNYLTYLNNQELSQFYTKELGKEPKEVSGGNWQWTLEENKNLEINLITQPQTTQILVQAVVKNKI